MVTTPPDSEPVIRPGWTGTISLLMRDFEAVTAEDALRVGARMGKAA